MVALRMASSRPAAAARRRGTAFFSELIRGLPIFSHSIRSQKLRVAPRLANRSPGERGGPTGREGEQGRAEQG